MFVRKGQVADFSAVGDLVSDAVAFYRKFGFVETGEIVGRHQIPRKVMIRKPVLDQSGCSPAGSAKVLGDVDQGLYGATPPPWLQIDQHIAVGGAQLPQGNDHAAGIFIVFAVEDEAETDAT